MKKQIVEFSGGKDSTAMFHMMLERGEQIDDVIFFDGGWDWPQMFEHLDLVEEKTGIKITRLKPEHDFDYYMFKHKPDPKRLKREPWVGCGWPGTTTRWCTREKAVTINRYLNELKKEYEVIQCVGFAVGEERRLKKKMLESQFRYPLIEYNVDEKECLLYCKRLGYTWGGLYEYFDRVSCFCCPMQSNKEILLKKRHFPEMWNRIREMDAELRKPEHKFSPGQRWKPKKHFSEIDAELRGKD